MIWLDGILDLGLLLVSPQKDSNLGGWGGRNGTFLRSTTVASSDPIEIPLGKKRIGFYSFFKIQRLCPHCAQPKTYGFNPDIRGSSELKSGLSREEITGSGPQPGCLGSHPEPRYPGTIRGTH